MLPPPNKKDVKIAVGKGVFGAMIVLDHRVDPNLIHYAPMAFLIKDPLIKFAIEEHNRC